MSERPQPERRDPASPPAVARVVAYGPACIGNVAAGFDVLGAALAPDLALEEAAAPSNADGAPAPANPDSAAAPAPELWGDLVEIAVAPEAGASMVLLCSGPFADQLPVAAEHNLVRRAHEAFARRLPVALPPLPPITAHLYKGLPVGSGLGSSSASVVATLRALNVFCGEPLDEAALLAAAGEAEAHASGAPHLDNVAAALAGGLCLVDPAGGVRRLPFPPGLRFVIASPELSVTTRAARAVLPPAVPLRLAVEHAQNLASLVHALHTGDEALLRLTFRDLLAEPYRITLVPGFRAVQAAAAAAGAWGCSFSGAGPALFALAPAPLAAAVALAMHRAWAAAGVAARWRICTVDEQGARVLPAAQATAAMAAAATDATAATAGGAAGRAPRGAGGAGGE